MNVIENKIEIFFCRVDTAWRIIEQDTSSSYTDLESEKGNNFNLFVFLEGFNSRKHYKGYPLLPNVEKQDNMIVCRSDIESSY